MNDNIGTNVPLTMTMKRDILEAKCPHCWRKYNRDYAYKTVQIKNNKVISIRLCEECNKEFMEVFEITELHKIPFNSSP